MFPPRYIPCRVRTEAQSMDIVKIRCRVNDPLDNGFPCGRQNYAPCGQFRADNAHTFLFDFRACLIVHVLSLMIL